jgi:hypothetical protein
MLLGFGISSAPDLSALVEVKKPSQQEIGFSPPSYTQLRMAARAGIQ